MISLKVFETNYPNLYMYFCFLTKEAVEKGNIDSYKRLAEQCNYNAMTKLIYHDISAVDLQFVKDKIASLSKRVRSGERAAKNTQHQIDRAIRGLNPFPGGKYKLPEPNVLMQEYANIVAELQKLNPLWDEISKEDLFEKTDEEFYKKIKEIYKESLEECEKLRETF